MSYRLLPIITLLFSIQLNAKTCEDPAVAVDDLNKKFKYGCFCGEDYPNIQHPSQKSYRELNSSQRDELIHIYQEIDPYDDIDSICKEHDICYISHQKEAKECNDAIYNSLNQIEDRFATDEDNLTHQQCKNLAFDIGSVFHTIFAPADDEDTIFDFGMLMVNTGVTVANKTLQESADTISDSYDRYPPKDSRCLMEPLHKPLLKEKSNLLKKVKIITIER